MVFIKAYFVFINGSVKSLWSKNKIIGVQLLAAIFKRVDLPNIAASEVWLLKSVASVGAVSVGVMAVVAATAIVSVSIIAMSSVIAIIAVPVVAMTIRPMTTAAVPIAMAITVTGAMPIRSVAGQTVASTDTDLDSMA